MNDLNGMGSSVDMQAVLLPTIIIAVLAFILSLVYLIAIIRIYTKANEAWWKAIVPIYNIIVLMDIAKVKYINLLFLLIPILGMFIFMIKLYAGLAKRFNKGTGFVLGLVFLPFIFIPLLAFSKDEKEVSNKNSSMNEVDNLNNDNQLLENAQSIESLQVSNIETLESSNLNVIDNNSSNNFEEQNNVVNNIESNVNELNTINQINENINNIELENVQSINQNNSIDNNIEQLEDISTNVGSNFEELDINAISNNDMSAFNSAPVFEMNSIEQNIDKEKETIEPISMSSDNNINVNNILNDNFNNSTVEPMNVVNDNIISTGKRCKNCGTEMPKIVTICPTCGTDNE